MAALVASQDLVVELDYGQFYLHTADNDPELPVALLERAQDGDGIAQDGGLVVVESPHQNNFEMPLRVEVWDSPAADDLDDWDEAFEARLDVAEAGLVYESPTMDFVELVVPPGTYYALITGRGFVASGWPGSTEPGDRWRIRLWPSETPIAARRLKRWIEPEGAADAVEEARAARRRQKQRPKRVFDMANPARRRLIERTEQFVAPSPDQYSGIRVDREAGDLDPATIFQVVPSQLMLVLAGPDIDSLDPHGYLRRARKSIAEIVNQVPDGPARPLRELDTLIDDTLKFDAADRDAHP